MGLAGRYYFRHIVFAALSAAQPAFAQSSPDQPSPVVDPVTSQVAPPRGDRPPSDLTGDLFGLRPALADAGVDLTAHYISETAWNFRGGERRDITETGEFGVGLRFDMQRIAGTDGVFQATVTYRRGKQLDAVAGLGTLQEVQEIYGRGQTFRLTQFWYEQKFLGGSLAIKAGRTAPSEDFAAFSCLFQNLSLCGSQPGNIVADYWYNWPVSQWGVRIRADHNGAYVQAAIYEENPRNLDKSFTIGRFKGATGALIPFEAGLRRGGRGGGPVGSYKIGGWISTANAPDVLLGLDRQPAVLTGLAPLARRSSHGVWISAEQQVTGRSEHGESISGLSAFLNIVRADRRTARVDSQIVAGLFLRNVLPGMANDLIGFGAARTHVNDRSERAGKSGGQPSRGAEYGFELFYGFRPLGWLDLRPNLQWIHHPGGDRTARGIGIVGLKAALRL